MYVCVSGRVGVSVCVCVCKVNMFGNTSLTGDLILEVVRLNLDPVIL